MESHGSEPSRRASPASTHLARFTPAAILTASILTACRLESACGTRHKNSTQTRGSLCNQPRRAAYRAWPPNFAKTAGTTHRQG